jgi:hypothetical protein
MLKLPGVQSVRVSLNDGLTILEMKPANDLTLARLRDVIKKNGFAPQEATVRVRGAVGEAGGTLLLRLDGAAEVLSLQRDAARASVWTALTPPAHVEIDGVVAAHSERLTVRDVRAAPGR